nr:protein AATF-like [Procambarus clarkii]
MAGALKSYVEKFLLNPAASFNVDEDGHQETKAQVVDTIEGDERADSNQQSVSKLRARSAALQADKDPRYKGKKVLRKDLKKDRENKHDPALAKYFSIEGEDSVESANENYSLKLKKNKVDSDEVDSDESDNYDSEEEGKMVKEIHRQQQKEPKHVTFVNDGDFSKFADDFDEEDDDDDDDDEDDDEEDDDDEDDNNESEDEVIEGEKDEEDNPEDSLKKFSTEDQSEEVKKGQAVKNQLGIHDYLFEGRIGLQKVVVGTNQLPQFNTYKLFLRENDPLYKKNLVAAKTAAKNLLDSILSVQELLLLQNPETSHIITGKKPKPIGTESDEEITSSEDDDAKETTLCSRGTKRKMKVEEYEDVLSKRHAALLPLRDQAINKWYEKTKLLSSRNARDKFSGFEVSALQQLNNILTNKQQLIRRTQLTGATRGTTYHVLGKVNDASREVDTEEYDPEIFDDTDFYTRTLEEMLKAKVSLSDNMTDVSRKWIEIQNLRRKAKRKVDKKASKGRKIRYEVMSKLQQYLAPCCPPRMDDAAINTLFASLFGKSIQKVQETTSH